MAGSNDWTLQTVPHRDKLNCRQFPRVPIVPRIFLFIHPGGSSSFTETATPLRVNSDRFTITLRLIAEILSTLYKFQPSRRQRCATYRIQQTREIASARAPLTRFPMRDLNPPGIPTERVNSRCSINFGTLSWMQLWKAREETKSSVIFVLRRERATSFVRCCTMVTRRRANFCSRINCEDRA